MNEVLVQHPHPVFVRIEEAISSRLHEQQGVHDGQGEQEQAVMDLRVRECETEKSRCRADSPVGRPVEPFPPGKAPGYLGPVIMDQGADNLTTREFFGGRGSMGHAFSSFQSTA